MYLQIKQRMDLGSERSWGQLEIALAANARVTCLVLTAPLFNFTVRADVALYKLWGLWSLMQLMSHCIRFLSSFLSVN